MTTVFRREPFHHSPALDGLRALAVVAVMVVHAARDWLPGGWLGVDVFFVLSGFLITTLLLQEFLTTGTIKLKNFYIRRALRLLPAMVALSLVLLLYSCSFEPEIARNIRREVFAGLFYFYNYAKSLGCFTSGVHLFAGHLWSLSVEEQFYLIWPLLILFGLRRLSGKQLLWATLPLFLAPTVCRLFLGESTSYLVSFISSLLFHGEIFIGCALALVANIYSLKTSLSSRTSNALGFAGLLSLTAAFIFSDPSGDTLFGGRWGRPVALMASCFLILHFHSSPDSLLSRWASCSWVVRIGQISYGLYLWHLPVYRFTWYSILPRVEFPDNTFLPFRFVLTFIVAVLSYVLIEKPALQLKKRFTVPRGTKPSSEWPPRPRTGPSDRGLLTPSKN